MSSELHLDHTLTGFSISRILLIRYGAAIGLVLCALCLSLLLHPFLSNAFLVFFLAAVMAAGWFGRTGPGLFSVAVSTMLIVIVASASCSKPRLLPDSITPLSSPFTTRFRKAIPNSWLWNSWVPSARFRKCL